MSCAEEEWGFALGLKLAYKEGDALRGRSAGLFKTETNPSMTGPTGEEGVSVPVDGALQAAFWVG